jgi:vacuolar protein sorting-associated protein 26
MNLTKEKTSSSSKPMNFNLNIFNRYFIRVTIIKKIFATKLSVEKCFLVSNPIVEPELNANVRMEVGISNAIHMEYELFKNKYSLTDCVVGKIYFIKVSMKVKTIEIHFIKKEIFCGAKSDSILISKFEIVDGSPADGDIVPIRMLLNGFALSPTYKELNNVISIKYFLKFVIIDEEDKSFYKQQEISLWRKSYCN